ncbi:MAG: hypothetical protein IJ043_00495 [Clostridia bacterium]|nr:hypothetical protein [Clostridia bacterium]
MEVCEVYKGECQENFITVKTSNGSNLSPELILYGEDETSILVTPLERLDLEIGKECILLLTNRKTEFPELNGYYPAKTLGYLTVDATGVYSNHNSFSPVKLSAEDPGAEIAAALNTVTE